MYTTRKDSIIGFLATLLIIIGSISITKFFIRHKDPPNINSTIILQELKLIREILQEKEICTLGVGSWYQYSLAGYLNYSSFHSTCASRDFKKGTMLIVTNLINNSKVVCRVNDYVESPNVIIDLSDFAFRQLAPLEMGIIKVAIKPI